MVEKIYKIQYDPETNWSVYRISTGHLMFGKTFSNYSTALTALKDYCKLQNVKYFDEMGHKING